MAGKKQSSKNTRKAQARASRGVSNKSKRNRATLKVQRDLLSGAVPKSFIDIHRAGQESIVVRGQEVVQQVDASKDIQKLTFIINPTVNELFPRLSTLSLAFERYRFRSVQLRFYTAAPATRSGSIGIRLNTDPMSHCPNDYISLAASRYSVVGSIAESLSTPAWTPRDPEDFYLRPQSRGSAAITAVNANALKTLQASIDVLTMHANDTDDGSIGGYLAITYEVELITPVETVQRTFYEHVSLNQTQVKSAVAADCRLLAPLRPLSTQVDTVSGQSVGAFPVEPQYTGLGRSAVDFWDSTDDKTASAISNLERGQYNIVVRQDVLAEEALLKRTELKDYNYVRVEQSTPRAAVPRLRLGSEPPATAFYNPDFVKDPASWEQPFPPGFGSDCKSVSDLMDQLAKLHASLTPLAAGDWAQVIYGYLPSTETWTALYSIIHPIGTSAYNGVGFSVFVQILEAVGVALASYPANNGYQRTLSQNRLGILSAIS